MFVTRISRYVYRSVLSAVPTNRDRTWNVLPVDTGAQLYFNCSDPFAGMVGGMP
jgi:hypothetical protein